MNGALAYAMELEKKGDIYGAMRICRGILRDNPQDGDAVVLFARLNLNHRVSSGVNMAMLERFLSVDARKQAEFKRWLIDV